MIEAVIGFVLGVLAGFLLWFPLFFALAAAFGDINAEMPGWAIAASIWFYFACGLIGAVIGHRSL